MRWAAVRLAGTLLVAVAAGGAAETRRLALPTNDLVADPLRGRIYASVPGKAGTIGNRVVTILPETVGFEASPLGAFVGSEPTRLALADDASVLYVALDGAPAVARVALSSFTRDAYIGLGFDASYGPRYAGDLAVVAGNPDVLAVALRSSFQSVVGVGIWDHGVMRPAGTATFTGPQWIEPSRDPTLLYGQGSYDGFQHLAVGPDGVTVLPEPPPRIGVSGADIHFDGYIIVTVDGQALDPATGVILGSYTAELYPGSVQRVQGPVASDPAHDRVYYAVANTSGVGPRWSLRIYDRSHFVLLETRGLPGITGQVRSVVHWGDDGVALGTDDGQVYLLASSFAPCSGASQCDDGDACTVDTCEAGACVHAALDCGADPCASGTCDPERGCVSAGHYGMPCADDGNPCTLDQCGSSATCEHQPAYGYPCDDDGIECTVDQCGSRGTCEHTVATGESCSSDDDACTADVCSANATCTHEPFGDDASALSKALCQFGNVDNALARALCTGSCGQKLRTRFGKINALISLALNDPTGCPRNLRAAAKQSAALAATTARLTSKRKLKPASMGHKLSASLRDGAKRLRKAIDVLCATSPFQDF